MDNYIKNIIEQLNEASSAYYNTGTSPLSDAEYDKLYDELCDYEAKFGIVYSNSPTSKVGAEVLDSVEKVKIDGKPMLSLDKVHSVEEIEEWANGEEIVGSVKCDGLSCRLVYENGWLKAAFSRGNGVEGQNILSHVKQFTNVPLIISKPGKYMIDGECIINYKNWQIVNKNNEFANPRNTAAGTLNLLDMSIVKQRFLSFIAWDVIEGGDYTTFKENLTQAADLGFDIVPIGNSNEEILALAQENNLPCDGVVWKINDIAYGESLGRTDKFFRGSISWKPAREEVETELLDIEWEVGRTGQVSPVAVYNPIEILGSECERASLHNLSIMEKIFGTLCPDRGTKIQVYKADMIIPQIASAESQSNGLPIALPEVCPYCGEQLIIKQENESKVLYCPNEDCNCRLLNKLTHYVSKTAMDIKGLSKETLNKLMDWNWINNFKDIYTLSEHRAEWVKKPGFGVKSVDNILNAIEKSKHCKLEQFITAIGIPLVGSKVAKDLAKAFGTWEEFLFAVEDKFKFYSLPNFGNEMHKAITSFDYTEANNIATKYLDFERVEAESANSSLEGLTFCITGKLSQARANIVTIIEAAGGKVTSSVSSKTNYLLNNDLESTSSKNMKAKSLNIPIITEDEFYSKFGLN